MNRLGFRHDNVGRTLPAVLASPNLRLEAVFTHFASADVPESTLLDPQRERFERASTVVDELVGGPVRRHACNSAALLRDSRVRYDAVRPGLLLYGIVPPPLASTIPLQPVMSLTSRVTAVKGLRPGEGVGYGWRFQRHAAVDRGRAGRLRRRARHAPRRPRLGADSRPPRAGRGRRVDGHDHRGRHRARRRVAGDEVVILGAQGDESWQRIDAREMAASIGTIPWEIVCRLGTRIERVYTSG